MARQRVQLAAESDFRGGLNLRSDAFLLGKNESPDLLNVNVDPRGGVRSRNGVQPWVPTGPGAAIKALIPFESATVSQIIAQRTDSQIYWRSGSTWTNIGLVTKSGQLRGTTFKNNLYMVDGTNTSPIKWTGAAMTVLTSTYNNNLDAPVGGQMPRAAVCATWQGCMFVANTTESGTAYPNRIRWSHPNFPEDWADFHFIDVDTGLDGDQITALVPFGDRLLVFKNKSMHAIYGTPPLGFRVYPISQELGCPGQEAIASTDMGVFWFSWPEGLHLFDGGQPKYLFERLQPAIADGQITDPGSIRLGYGNRRVWVSCTYNATATCFVLDPTIDKDGAWTRYDLAVGPFLDWEPINSDPFLLAGHEGNNKLLKLDVHNQYFDDFGGADIPIESYYRTRWFDIGTAAVKKRWRRPEMVLKGGTASTIEVDVFHDYDPSSVKRRFSLASDADIAAGVWDVSLWDGAVWGSEGDRRNVIQRGPGLGTARSIAFKFHGPVEALDWGVDSITVKYVPRPVR